MMIADIDDLNFRRGLAQYFIKLLDQLPNDTEGKQSAMEEYKRQLAEIDARITELTGTPPPITVGLQTARLFGESKLGTKEIQNG